MRSITCSSSFASLKTLKDKTRLTEQHAYKLQVMKNGCNQYIHISVLTCEMKTTASAGSTAGLSHTLGVAVAGL